jgi:hypothetical protein
MYADEYLPDDAIEYFDVSDVSIEETSSIDTEERDRRKTHELYKSSDPDFYYYKKVVRDDDGNSVVRKTQIYSSPLAGKIRNAPTGVRESDVVGSIEEDFYFRVKDTALYTKTELNMEPRKLFYRNPEECERHLNIVLSKAIKQSWHNKQLTLKS